MLAESIVEFNFLVLKSIAIQYLQERYVDKRSVSVAHLPAGTDTGFSNRGSGGGVGVPGYPFPEIF